MQCTATKTAPGYLPLTGKLMIMFNAAFAAVPGYLPQRGIKIIMFYICIAPFFNDLPIVIILGKQTTQTRTRTGHRKKRATAKQTTSEECPPAQKCARVPALLVIIVCRCARARSRAPFTPWALSFHGRARGTPASKPLGTAAHRRRWLARHHSTSTTHHPAHQGD